MNRKRIKALLLALFAAVSLTACQPRTGSSSSAASSANAASGETAGVAVQTRTVTADSISTDNTVSGTVSADDKSTIMVAVTAKCVETYAEAGDSVEKGQVLCRLDLDSTLSSYDAANISYNSAVQSYNDQKAVFDQQIALAEQQIAMSDQQIAVTEQQLTLTEKNANDLKALFEIGAASQAEVDNAQLQLDQMRMQLDSTRLQRDQAQMQLQSAIATRNSTLAQLEAGIQSSKSNVQQMDTALENIDARGNVIAPISGTLVTMNAVKDSYVSASAPVAVIDGAGQMLITVSVSEALVPKLGMGDEADVTVAALDSSFTAAIRSVEQAANAMTKLYTVTLTVPQEVEGLLSGMFANVTFHTDSVDNAIVIPSEAILTNGQTQYVYVVENDTARYIEVTTGLTGSGVTEVTGGLTAGQELVVVGQTYLNDGAAVRVVGEG